MAFLDLQQRANLHANSVRIAIDPSPFDGGQDGSVWHTDRRSVVKAFERFDNGQLGKARRHSTYWDRPIHWKKLSLTEGASLGHGTN